MKNKLKTWSGETLLEVVIAVSVLMIVMAPASALFVNLIQNTALKRDNATASYRAEDGLEVLRGMRDSNLRNFSSKKSVCWNTKPEYGNIDDCQNPSNKILAGIYRLEENPVTLEWTLKLEINGELSLKLDSQDSQQDDFYRLLFYPVTSSYNYTSGDITPFYRQITIEYLEFKNPPTGTDWTSGDDAMKVTSTVRFRNGSKIQEIKLGEILTKPASL